MLPDTLQVDPNSGYLCHWVYWRPNPKLPDPEMPGEKLSMITYIPAEPDSACLCGSGKLYGDCCRLKPYWHPLCPDPGWQGSQFSLVTSPSATFRDINRVKLGRCLMEDVRLQCTVDEPKAGFWIYWGTPALQASHGVMCFGDFEIKPPSTLLVTAMSDLRMRILLDLLQEIAGDLLGEPQMRYKPVAVIDKRSRNTIQLPDPRAKKGRRR